MVWYIISAILFLIAIGILIFNYVRERRFLKRKTSEAMSEEMWEEIEAERDAARERQRKFHDALEEAQHKDEKK